MTLEELRAAVEATWASGGARADSLVIHDWRLPDAETWKGRALQGALRGTAVVAKEALRLLNHGEPVDLRRFQTTGTVDLRRGRWHAECENGTCGVNEDSLSVHDPVWMLVALRSAIACTGNEVVVDLIDASDRWEPELPLPSAPGARALRNYRLEVTLADGRIARVVHEEVVEDFGREATEVDYRDYDEP